MQHITGCTATAPASLPVITSPWVLQTSEGPCALLAHLASPVTALNLNQRPICTPAFSVERNF